MRINYDTLSNLKLFNIMSYSGNPNPLYNGEIWAEITWILDLS